MTRLLSLFAAVLLAFATFTTAAAANDEMRGFIDPSGAALVVSAFDAGSPSSARSLVRMLTDADIEDIFDGWVIASDTMPPIEGMSAGRMFALLDRDGQSVLVVILAAGPTVYFGGLIADEIRDGDGTVLGETMGYVVALGMDFPTPRGFTEIPMRENDSPFPTTNEVRS